MSQPQSPIRKVALAGATGYLGAPLLSALRAANFEITVLIRPQSKPAAFPADVRVVRVNLSSPPALTEALRGHDAFISAVTTSAVATQRVQIDAAIAAGVRRYIPSEFGSDTSLPTCRTLPVYADKIAAAEYVVRRCRATDSRTTYTLVYTNSFLDYGLDHGFFMDLNKKRIELYDGGDFPITVSPTDFVGRGVVAILRNPEATANREIRLQGAVVTQRGLWAVAKKFLGEEGWGVEEVSSAEKERQANENLKRDPEDIFGWIWGMLVRACFGKGYSRDFIGNHDNELLGLKEISEADIEGFVKRSIDTGFSSIV